MAKQAYVYSGTDWVPLASEVTNLSSYYTSAEVDILDAPTGLKLIVPTSVAVGSGTGTANAAGQVTFTGASSVSLNGVFTSTYDNYKILFQGSCSIAADLAVRMRLSGTDNTTSNYQHQQVVGSSTTVSGSRATNGTSARIGEIYPTTSISTFSVDFFNPAIAVPTSFFTNAGLQSNTSIAISIEHNAHNVATAFDGLTFIPSSGNLTGTLSVYGYKD